MTFLRTLLLLIGCATWPASAQRAAASLTPAASQAAWVAACPDAEAWDDWERAAPPYRIHGNSWYVGTCGITAILITGAEGHILIDGGTRTGGPRIAASIAALGFDLHDVKLLLHSHEHFDHVGGLAWVQAQSGATVIASRGAAAALRTGMTQPGDPQFGLHDPFDPVVVGREVHDGDVVTLGDLALTALETPGHTPGGLTWTWRSCEGEDCTQIVYLESLGPISGPEYRFSDHPEYVARFRAAIARVAGLPCDIALTPHPGASEMPARMATPSGLIGPDECRLYAEFITERLDRRLAVEASEK
jgi:metallo-beta-lactamase class B